MARADLIVATGGQPMVRAAYSSGTPAYGVGAGNSTMIIDETANIEEAARNTRLSKTSDFGSGCSADGNLIIEASIFDKLLAQLQLEGGYLATRRKRQHLRRRCGTTKRHRTAGTVAIAPQQLAQAAGFTIPADRKFIIVHGDGIGKEHPFSGEKLTTLLAVYKYKGFDQALEMMRGVYEVGGKGHSCGIYSFDQDHIHRLALAAPVSRIMVRQPQSKANAGAFNNGMPMTSSLGCGTWGGNIVSENVHLKHYLNTTWVSVPIKEDRPSDEELFGPFYDPAMEAEFETDHDLNAGARLTASRARCDPPRSAGQRGVKEQHMKDLISNQLVKYLEARGIEHIFGLCGHTNIAVLAALKKSRDQVRQRAARADRRARRGWLCTGDEEGLGRADAPEPRAHQRGDRRRQRRARLDPDGRHRGRRAFALLRQAPSSGSQPACGCVAVRDLPAVRQARVARGFAAPVSRDHREGLHAGRERPARPRAGRRPDGHLLAGDRRRAVAARARQREVAREAFARRRNGRPASSSSCSPPRLRSSTSAVASCSPMRRPRCASSPSTCRCPSPTR